MSSFAAAIPSRQYVIISTVHRLLQFTAYGLVFIPPALVAAPPEVTGAGGDGRIDIVMLTNPPWWAHTELLVIIGVLFSVVVVVGIWNRSLNIIARRRACRLAQEEIAHARTKLKVEERTELAVEIHDAVSQSLTGIALQLDAAIATGRSDPERTVHILSTASQMLSSCRHELRCCLWDLRSRTFEEHDLTEAISRSIAPHLNEVNAHVRFNVPRKHLSESTTHDIIKIVRELTVNAIRHGQAKHIHIAGEMHDNRIRFSVADDGCGFDKETAPGPHEGHFGLQGIKERVRKYGGVIDLTSSTDGTKVSVTMNNCSERENE